MKKIALIAAGVLVACMATSAVVHRNVIAAAIKGEPLPEPPAWHKWHTCAK